jgi:hypothetical protein
MEDFTYKSVAILGRLPALGVAELESIYGADGLKRLENAALLDTPAEEIDFKRLGGVIKVARILTVLPGASWSESLDYLIEKVPQHLQHVPEGKFTLGVSVYGLRVNIDALNRGPTGELGNCC